MIDDPNDYDDDGHEGEDDDDFDFDCHMRPDGQCGAAGSEMCDFECPTMAAIHHHNYTVRQKYLDDQATERALMQEREFAGRQLWLPMDMPALGRLP